MKNTTIFYSTVSIILLLSCSETEKDSNNLPISVNLETSLSTTSSPAENFNLTNWYLSVPIVDDGGDATSVYQITLNKDYELSNYFYTDPVDGAMVFRNYIDGAKTSSKTQYTRCELREMVYG